MTSKVPPSPDVAEMKQRADRSLDRPPTLRPAEYGLTQLINMEYDIALCATRLAFH